MDELQALVRRHKFWKNNFRTNIGQSVTSKYGGKPMLLEGVYSNTIRGAGKTEEQARMLQLVRQMLPDLQEPMLTLNRNVTCLPHRDKRNVGHSYIAFFDGKVPFEGGQLIVQEPQGNRVIFQKNVWHRFSGNDVHWNLPHTGEKLSIVAYQGPKPEPPGSQP